MYVADLAALTIDLAGRTENLVLDAVGPETYRFEDLVRLIGSQVGSRARTVHIPPALALATGRVIGWLLRDVVITRDEIAGLMAELLISGQPPSCPTRFSQWLAEHAAEVGTRYASELSRHYT